ncbi:MAG: diacylglycerol/lipid kinase family protein [Treponemataceae bacterium]
MVEKLSSSLLAKYMEPIIGSCSLWKDKILHVFIISNPQSGGFTQLKVAEHNLKVLKQGYEAARETATIVKSIDISVFETGYACHSMEYVEKILNDMEPLLKDREKSEHRVLIITAGGDGTSLEVQTRILRYARQSAEKRSIIEKCYCVLRLPFGTGNDGSDGRTFEECLLRLTFPSHIELQKAVEVVVEGSKSGVFGEWNKDKKDNVIPPWYSFNIASIGIDAFITHMTNRMKDKLPGDFYKLWVDLACLFYNKYYKAGNAHIEIFDGEELKGVYDGTFEFCLLGISGHRTYGSNHKILPKEESVCITPTMKLLRKLKTKESFNDGTHHGTDYSFHYFGNKLRIFYDEDILVQVDGESHLLKKENFPIVMQQTEPIIPVIKLDK